MSANNASSRRDDSLLTLAFYRNRIVEPIVLYVVREVFKTYTGSSLPPEQWKGKWTKVIKQLQQQWGFVVDRRELKKHAAYINERIDNMTGSINLFAARSNLYAAYPSTKRNVTIDDNAGSSDTAVTRHDSSELNMMRILTEFNKSLQAMNELKRENETLKAAKAESSHMPSLVNSLSTLQRLSQSQSAQPSSSQQQEPASDVSVSLPVSRDQNEDENESDQSDEEVDIAEFTSIDDDDESDSEKDETETPDYDEEVVDNVHNMEDDTVASNVFMSDDLVTESSPSKKRDRSAMNDAINDKSLDDEIAKKRRIVDMKNKQEEAKAEKIKRRKL